MSETLPQKALRAVNDFPTLDSSEAAAQIGIGKSAVEIMRAALRRDPSVVEGIASGELASMHAVGYAAKLPSIVNRPDRKVPFGSVFGKGDPFNEAIAPLRRYLAGWQRREFKFTHVNPREARRRVEVIDALIETLTEARADLEQRSHKARLRVTKETR
jgi:hypothetical protein